MRIKHYLVIMLVLLMIAFMQPLIVFLGNLLLIVAAAAYIYSDMTPEAQARYEQKAGDLLDKIRHGLRNKHPPGQQLILTRGERLRRALGSKPQPEAAEEAVAADSGEAGQDRKID